MDANHLKILTVSNCPLIESQGSGYVTVNFARELRDRGHIVHTFGPDDYELWQRFRGRANQYRTALGMVGFVWRQLNKYSYDLIEFYGAESWLTVWLLRRFWKRLPVLVNHSNGLETHVIVCQQNSADLRSRPPKWYQLDQSAWFHGAFKNVDGVVVQSDFDRTYGLAQGYQDSEHLVTIPSGLPDLYLNRPLKCDRAPVLGYCGSWLDRKGIQVLSRDVGRILQDYPNCRLKLIGIGDAVQLADYFPPQVLNQIEVIPFVSDKAALAEIYESVSIFLMPSIYESFGLVAAEAIACGCALIAANVGIVTHLKDEREVLKISEPRSPHLYHAIQQLLEDDSLRCRLAQNSHAAVQAWTWKRAIDQIEQTYQTWCAQQPKQR